MPKAGLGTIRKGSEAWTRELCGRWAFFFGETQEPEMGEVLVIEEIPGVRTENEVFQTCLDEARI